MRIFTFLGIFPLMALSLCGGWDARLAASYLDARQQEWLRWPPAKATGGTCLSCHTGATYLLARPALRRELGLSRPTSYETGLLEGLRARAGLLEAKEVSPALAAEPLALLGALAYDERNRGEKVHGIASAHGAVGTVTGIAYGAAMLSVVLDRKSTRLNSSH